MEYEGNLFWKKDFFFLYSNGPPPLVPEKDKREIKREREKEVQVFKESSRKKRS